MLTENTGYYSHICSFNISSQAPTKTFKSELQNTCEESSFERGLSPKGPLCTLMSISDSKVYRNLINLEIMAGPPTNNDSYTL